MAFQSLQLQNFRNLSPLNWELAPGLNVLEGENAQGKTNLLEALYVLANGKSFRTTELASLIHWEKSQALLQAQIEHQNLISEISLALDKETKPNKNLKLNGKPKRSFREIHTKLSVLAFTPDSTTLFRTSPSIRRHYFDAAMARHYPHYNTILNRYVRVLRQRNLMLEQRASASSRYPFDQQWAELSLQLITARRQYLKELLPLWEDRLQKLTQSHGPFKAQWVGALSDLRELSLDSLLELLKTVKIQEERWGRTALGPHREDLEIRFSDKLVKEAASQGQHRMLTISLKLAEADLFVQMAGQAPVFLLDDIGSELDEKHLSALLKILGELHAQTVLTTAHRGEYDALGAQTFRVKEGKFNEYF